MTTSDYYFIQRPHRSSCSPEPPPLLNNFWAICAGNNAIYSKECRWSPLHQLQHITAYYSTIQIWVIINNNYLFYFRNCRCLFDWRMLVKAHCVVGIWSDEKWIIKKYFKVAFAVPIIHSDMDINTKLYVILNISECVRYWLRWTGTTFRVKSGMMFIGAKISSLLIKLLCCCDYWWNSKQLEERKKEGKLFKNTKYVLCFSENRLHGVAYFFIRTWKENYMRERKAYKWPNMFYVLCFSFYVCTGPYYYYFI